MVDLGWPLPDYSVWAMVSLSAICYDLAMTPDALTPAVLLHVDGVREAVIVLSVDDVYAEVFGAGGDGFVCRVDALRFVSHAEWREVACDA